MALNGTQWHSISISAPAFELVRGDEDRGAVDEPLVLRQLSEEFGRHLAAEDARVPDEGGFQGPSGVIRGHQSSSCRRRLPRTPCRHRHQSSVVISRHQSSSVVISRHQSSSVVISRHLAAYALSTTALSPRRTCIAAYEGPRGAAASRAARTSVGWYLMREAISMQSVSRAACTSVGWYLRGTYCKLIAC